MSTSNLWNLKALNGVDPNPLPHDKWVNFDPSDIDIIMDGGSGKFKIAFFQRSGSSYEPFFKDEIEAGIAHGSYSNSRALSPDGMSKVLQGLPRFKRHIAASGSDRVFAYTTGAVRYAMDETPEVCAAFIAAAEHALGYSLNNIQGTREAELQLYGALAHHPNMSALVGGMGGSTFEGGIIDENSKSFSHAVETGLGSHTAFAEHRATKISYKVIVDRELLPLKILMRASKERKLPFIAAGSIFRRVVRLLFRQIGPSTPLYMNFVSGVPLRREIIMPFLAEWASLSGRQLEKLLRPSLRESEKETWDKKIASYCDRLPIAAQAIYEIMNRSEAPVLLSSTTSTRAGVLFADRHNLDISDITSRPISSKRPSSLARLGQALHA